ncbi:exonuclease SbcCD subunit D [Fusibacter sp. JL216-2]|uniref:exonuclease SbcCD subunit D n=1 Tax=Fusibacter sp. JL216-2 TaxID=3071453 RepID=UPI003D32B7E5
MRVLHTSDWHLGKHLEGFSRLEEQRHFLNELYEICDEKSVDVVIIAGDIYDTSNPPAQAEKLYYEAIKKISKNGKRPVFAIAGNHDNPDRIQAAWPLASEQAILLAGHPKMDGYEGTFGDYEIKWLGDNVYALKIKSETLKVGLLPYPSERRLGEVLSESDDEKLRQASYSKRLEYIFDGMDTHFSEDAFNIAVSHIFVMGGQTTESERPIQIGGTLVVDPHHLPKKADYIALGHLHRPQSVKHSEKPALYSGAPLQYSRSEIAYSKSVHILEKDMETGLVDMEEVLLSLPKPIEVWKCSGIDEAIKTCEDNKDRTVWVYLEITTDEVLAQSDIKTLKEIKPDLLSIMPIMDKKEDVLSERRPEEKGFENLFTEYYEHTRGAKPSEALQSLLGSILNDEVDHETDQTEDQWIEQLYRDTDN